MMKKIMSICSVTVLSLVMFGSVVYAGTNLENGRIYFNGYQTDKKIVSEIYDTDLTDNYNYKMEAIVYVGNTRYGSGWKNDYAYKSANRVWYANETSRYQYARR